MKTATHVWIQDVFLIYSHPNARIISSPPTLVGHKGNVFLSLLHYHS